MCMHDPRDRETSPYLSDTITELYGRPAQLTRSRTSAKSGEGRGRGWNRTGGGEGLHGEVGPGMFRVERSFTKETRRRGSRSLEHGEEHAVACRDHC